MLPLSYWQTWQKWKSPKEGVETKACHLNAFWRSSVDLHANRQKLSNFRIPCGVQCAGNQNSLIGALQGEREREGRIAPRKEDTGESTNQGPRREQDHMEVNTGRKQHTEKDCKGRNSGRRRKNHKEQNSALRKDDTSESTEERRRRAGHRQKKRGWFRGTPFRSPLQGGLKGLGARGGGVSCFYSFGEPLTDGLTQCLCIDRTLLYS